ncbi:MAG: discoidin domain-containing protein [Opitutaceae bacterium]
MTDYRMKKPTTAQSITRSVLTMLLGLSVASSIHAADFYVSPDGSDKNRGSLKAPFASIAHAQSEVRAFKDKNPSEPIDVYLRGGKYYLTEPVVFSPADSGSAAAPIAYKAYQGETPQVLGGVNLPNLKWQKYDGGIYKTHVPKGLVFETLFIDGEQQTLARYPNYTEDAPAFNGVAADCLSKERVATWADPTYGYFHAMHPARWGGIHFQITGKKNKNEVILEGGTQNNRGSGKHKEHRYVENIFEELDAPGEWYLNRKTSELFFYPRANINLNSAEVEVAALEQLFVFKGTESQPVRHISIEGLTLKRTIRTFMKTADRLLRSDWTIYRGGVVHFEGTENCAIKDCELTDLGGNAVFFNNYNKDSLVQGCHIYNVGGSGVAFVGNIDTVWHENYNINNGVDLDELNFTRGPKTNDYPQQCTVDNNLIHNIGTVEKQTAGVQISLAAYIDVSRNSIYDVPRAGINIGEGKWGGHVLEYNDVFLTVQETHDHGAFNSWGRDRYYTKNRGAAGDRVAIHGYDLVRLDMIEKIVIRNNRWRCDHGWDIDLDDGSAWYEIYNNVCLSGGIKLRDGMLRTVYNNININNSMNLHVWLKNSGDVITNNISTHGYIPIGMRQWGKLLDKNLFFQKDSLKKIQNSYGTDPNSVYGDPMFADPANGDYTVTNTELAEAIGWKNFPMDQFGVQKPSLKRIAKIPEFPEIELTPDEVIPGIDYMGGVIKNIVNDGEKSAAGLPDYKGAKIVRGLKKGLFSVVKLQDDDVVLAMDDEAVDNIDDFMKKLASEKAYRTISVWRFQKLIILELPDPADCNIPMLLKKDDWKVISFDSEASGYEARLAIDNDPKTFWHTQFEPTEPPFPHELVVDMGAESILYSFEYLPRQGSSHPRIKDFELYLVADGKTSDEPILTGTFKDFEDLQSFPLNKVKARYFKLIGLSGYTRKAGSVGEISFYGTCVPE